ncbi:MAG: hypothetical protein ABL958_14350, partial [Bdellovibrionia bacterium]
MKYLWLVIAPLFFASTLFADGGMVSSGGDLLRDSHNPWWLGNTPIVRYCIEIDQPTVSASPQKIEEMVTRALEFWKTEFNRKLKI